MATTEKNSVVITQMNMIKKSKHTDTQNISKHRKKTAG